MTASIFAFHSTPWNLTNLPQFVAFKTLDNLYGACEVDIDRGDLVVTKIGNLVLSIVDKADHFRNLNWNKNIEILDRALDLGQSVVLGNYHRENLEHLKMTLGDRLTIIAMHWEDRRCREIFARCFAALHWQRLQDGKLLMTPHDIDIQRSGIDTVAYYSKSFLEQSILPIEMPQWTCHSISFQDFFIADRFYRYIETALQQSLSEEAKKLYHNWVDYYQPYIGK